MRSLKHVSFFVFFISILSLLNACSLSEAEQPVIACPIEDESYCDFVRELEPLIAAQDVDAILAKVELRCCSGTAQNPDAPPDPDFDPDEECVLSGAILGHGSCTPISDFGTRWSEDAPFTVKYILRFDDIIFQPSTFFDEPALIVSTSDDDWDLAFMMRKDSDNWIISGILGIRKDLLSHLSSDNFIPWPPGSPTLIAPPYVTPKG